MPSLPQTNAKLAVQKDDAEARCITVQFYGTQGAPWLWDEGGLHRAGIEWWYTQNFFPRNLPELQKLFSRSHALLIGPHSPNLPFG